MAFTKHFNVMKAYELQFSFQEVTLLIVPKDTYTKLVVILVIMHQRSIFTPHVNFKKAVVSWRFQGV